MQGDEYGPPTELEDAWFTQTVASLDYPKVKRDPKPMNGQMSLTDALNAPYCGCSDYDSADDQTCINCGHGVDWHEAHPSSRVSTESGDYVLFCVGRTDG